MISVPSVKPFAVRSPMAEYVEFGTTRSSGTWGGNNTAQITWEGSPNLTVEWGGTGWSGGAATQVYSVGGYGTNTQSISRAVSGAGSKTIRCYPTDTSGRRIGKITQITLILSFSNPANGTNPLTSVDVKNARELNYLSMATRNESDTFTSLDVSEMKKLTTFTLGSFGKSGFTTSVNVTDCTALTSIGISGQLGMTSIIGLSSLKNNLQTLSLRDCALTSLDVSDFGSLYNLDLRGCGDLTSLRAQNVMLYTTYYYAYGGYAYSLVGGADLQSTGLTAGALNQFYTDLATETTANPAIIAVYGSAGAGSSDASIATAKNYTVIGNIPPL